jgi:hypothetical protein
MDAVRIWLTVFFDDPFWVGVLERNEGGATRAARLVFGAEPKDCEVYRLLLERYFDLSFSVAVADDKAPPALSNPKRMQREAARSLAQSGVGTKAQQALSRQREMNRAESHERTRRMRDEAEERKFLLRQEKRKQKHRGR